MPYRVIKPIRATSGQSLFELIQAIEKLRGRGYLGVKGFLSSVQGYQRNGQTRGYLVEGWRRCNNIKHASN